MSDKVMMKKNIKHFLTLCIMMFMCTMHAVAGVNIKAQAPDVVEEGEQFRLSFTINTQDVSSFSFPETLNNFSIDNGPSQSSQSSFQIINGKASHSSSITYTYILSALKKGTYTLPAAVAVIDGKKVKSNSVRIEVMPSSGGQNNTSGQRSGSQHLGMQQAGEKITGKDLFITVTASKHKLYEQEAVVLTYKLYSLVNISQLMGGMPELEGFHTQEVQLPQQKQLKMERHNGRTYGTVVWRQYVLFPQRSGKLTIPSIKFEGIVVQQNRNIDPIDAFFGGGSAMVEVKKTIKAPAVTLDVMALPKPQPANFSGGVGHFDISAHITPDEIKSNDALTLQLKVSGSGNIKLLKTPKVNFPADFESYDAKVTDQIKATSSGVQGTKVFDYLAVPRHPGNYDVPAVEFCYFDTKSNNYKTIKTQPFKLQVKKGNHGPVSDATYTEGEDVKQIATDVRYIHRGNVHLKKPGETFFASTQQALCYIIPLLLAVILGIAFRKKAAEQSNIALYRGKAANKVASKRLKKAAALMNASQTAAFYDEILKGVWGYVSDKLNISVAELSKDNVSEKLQQKGVQPDEINTLLQVIKECEFARYAPADQVRPMTEIYNTVATVIKQIESTIK